MFFLQELQPFAQKQLKPLDNFLSKWERKRNAVDRDNELYEYLFSLYSWMCVCLSTYFAAKCRDRESLEQLMWKFFLRAYFANNYNGFSWLIIDECRECPPAKSLLRTISRSIHFPLVSSLDLSLLNAMWRLDFTSDACRVRFLFCWPPPPLSCVAL